MVEGDEKLPEMLTEMLPEILPDMLTEKLTRQVAHLARIELTEHEVQLFTAQFQNIISYVQNLQEVQVEGIEPMTHPFEHATPFRSDEVQAFAPGIPPGIPEGGFKVPAIL